MVINGLAITAGSNPNLLASIGRKLPINFAISIVTIKVKHTTKAIVILTLSISISFAKLAIAKVIPQRIATLNSFHNTLNESLYSISSNDKLLITDTDA